MTAQAGVEKGKASSIMCSYNAETYGEGIYGKGNQGGAIPSCANKGILNDLARDQWGFDGYITSDCGDAAATPNPSFVSGVRHPHGNLCFAPCAGTGAVGNVQNEHRYTPNSSATVKAVFTAGMDTDCGGFMGEKTMGALLDDPQIASLAEIALKNLFRVQLRLGFADPPELVTPLPPPRRGPPFGPFAAPWFL